MVIPASGPRPLKLAPQLAPASVMYGRFVYAMLPYDELVALCQAQYCVPNPVGLFPCAVAITYCTLALLEEVVLPKCAAAFTASAASCDCEGCDGAAEPLSDQTPAKMPGGLLLGVPLLLQNRVPLPTPWQYWVTLLSQELPPAAP